MVLIHVFLYHVLNSVKKNSVPKASDILERDTSRRKGVFVCVCKVYWLGCLWPKVTKSRLRKT